MDKNKLWQQGKMFAFYLIPIHLTITVEYNYATDIIEYIRLTCRQMEQSAILSDQCG